MQKRRLFFSLNAILLLGLMAAPAMADKYADTIAVFKKSEVVQPFFDNAYGYAVFPTIGKAGIGIGGS